MVSGIREVNKTFLLGTIPGISPLVLMMYLKECASTGINLEARYQDSTGTLTCIIIRNG